MADTLLANRERAAASPILDRLGLARRRYAVMTLHRPANVDEGTTLARLLDILEAAAAELPVVAPLHPRLRAALGRSGLDGRLRAIPGLQATEPLGYLDFLKLMDNAAVVLTDSGGVQEETTVLGVPCLTLRDNTERPVTVETGTNRVVGRDPGRVLAAFREAVSGRWPAGRAPRWWDGRTAGRIVEVLRTKLASADGGPPAAGEG